MALTPLSLLVGRRARFCGDWRRCPFWDNSLVPASLAAIPPSGVTPLRGCRSCAALRLRKADRLRSFCQAGTPRSLPSHFPKRNSCPRVAVAMRPLARTKANNSAYPPPPILAGRQSRMSQSVRHPAKEGLENGRSTVDVSGLRCRNPRRLFAVCGRGQWFARGDGEAPCRTAWRERGFWCADMPLRNGRGRFAMISTPASRRDHPCRT
jgi:hypothetical protein